MSGRKVLVTGGAGFIGSHVAEAYQSRGDQVWVVDNLSSGKRSNVAKGIELVEMDIGDARLAQLFGDVGGFDIVNHHAAQLDVRSSVIDPRNDARINVDGFLNVAENALKHGTKRMVFVSSGGVVYGEPEQRPTPETAPKRPMSPYGVTKLTAEHYLFYYANVHGLEYAAMRYSNVYGPRQDPHGEAGVVAIFCNRIIAGTSIKIFGDGAQTRDYVYVGDVVAANMLASDVALPAAESIDSRAFNVGTGVETSVNQLADEMMAAADAQIAKEYAPARPGEVQNSSLDASKIRALGWAPRQSLRNGLAATYRHIAGQGVPA
ncbi:MAG TPA: NAD-dependent epimerase/dehydratase family protein [Longimicrobiales bacterium]